MSGKLGDFQKKFDEAQPLLQTRCIMIREIFGEASLNPIMEDRQIFGIGIVPADEHQTGFRANIHDLGIVTDNDIISIPRPWPPQLTFPFKPNENKYCIKPMSVTNRNIFTQNKRRSSESK